MASGTVESSSQGSNPDQQQQQQGVPSRSKLVQRLLATSANLPAFINDLLTTQAVVVAGTEAAGFLLEKADGQFGLKPIAHIRPDQSDQDTRQAAINAFTEIIKPCIQQNKDGAIEVSGGAAGDVEPQFCLVTLLRNEGEVVAASAVITRCRDVERAQQRLMSMQLVAGYFDLFTLRRSVDQSRSIAQSHQHVLQLATAVATAEGFNSASMNLCNELATRTGATRVSLGWLKGTRVRVKALSHTEQFDKRQELIVQIERAMEECLDQEEIVHHDGTMALGGGEEGGGGTQNVTREAQALSRAQGGNTVISLPLRRQSEIIGVLTLEFSPGTKLGPQAATGLAVAADLLAPQLYDRYQNDRWLITKTGISIRETAKLAIGPKHMLAKTVIVLLAGITLFLCLYSPMYRVPAKFTLLPVENRFITAPYEGQIAEVLFDITKDTTVTEGQPLVRLETSQLKLQLAQAQLQAAQAEAKRSALLDDRAQDGRSRVSEARQAELERDEAYARAEELQWKIDNATITAPFTGQILQGDLKNKIMAPVKEGETLIEIGRRDKLRGELKVAERDIQDVKKGQKGMLRTSAQPGDKYAFTVENVVPKADPVEGQNKFVIYAELKGASDQWYPGQEGEARIDVRPEPLIWQWTHRLVEFVRLKLWI
ncbi:MAG TPA: HlyD family efflux transporter periplasmic adaptor subunit [Tepidisphaeraceae bacterium]|nr:HlyD family efflux transporter periplasmic adaptor subunit [Tepidisphaeraceae bacterium]